MPDWITSPTDTACVIQHDVDLVPGFFAQVPYHQCSRPTHLTVRPESLNFALQYPTIIGGAVTMHIQYWASINGMDFQFQGWGGEDDDLHKRVAYMGLADCSKPWAPPHRPKQSVVREWCLSRHFARHGASPTGAQGCHCVGVQSPATGERNGI